MVIFQLNCLVYSEKNESNTETTNDLLNTISTSTTTGASNTKGIFAVDKKREYAMAKYLNAMFVIVFVNINSFSRMP